MTPISTHAPHARRDFPPISILPTTFTFLLTRLMRGATKKLLLILEKKSNFYSRASCEARLIPQQRSNRFARFLLTRLMRGATRSREVVLLTNIISTHAPHARRDGHIRAFLRSWENFYSRASCEARPPCYGSQCRITHFYSRASCEARLMWSEMQDSNLLFLLTRLMRGATS